VCYENGEGVEQDWEEALKWYRKAEEQGMLLTDIIWKLDEIIRIKKIVNTAKHYLFFYTKTTGCRLRIRKTGRGWCSWHGY